MDMKSFLKQNVRKPEEEKVIATKRVLKENGEPEEWIIKAITNTTDDRLRKNNTKTVNRGKGVYVPELDTTAYLKDLVVNSVVYPDLENKEAQDSWNVMGTGQLLDCLLLPGEYNALVEKVQKINGWDISLPDLVDEAKN